MTTATRWMACTLALTAWLGPAGPVAAQDAEYEARIPFISYDRTLGDLWELRRYAP